MIEFQTNAFKRALSQGKLQIGLWSSLCSNIGAEVIADERLRLDPARHGAFAQRNSRPGVPIAGATARHRVADRAAGLERRGADQALLDIGAQTLLVPYVQNADEAKRAVAATRYPPQGIRGVAAARASHYGRVPGYLTKANDEICVSGAGRNPQRARSARSDRQGRRGRRRIHLDHPTSQPRSDISAIHSTRKCKRPCKTRPGGSKPSASLPAF